MAARKALPGNTASSSNQRPAPTSSTRGGSKAGTARAAGVQRVSADSDAAAMPSGDTSGKARNAKRAGDAMGGKSAVERTAEAAGGKSGNEPIVGRDLTAPATAPR